MSDLVIDNKETRDLTPQENAVHDSIDIMEDVQDASKEFVNDMFELMDLKALLKDPKKYMTEFGKIVVIAHKKRLEDAALEGRVAAKKIIKAVEENSK